MAMVHLKGRMSDHIYMEERELTVSDFYYVPEEAEEPTSKDEFYELFGDLEANDFYNYKFYVSGGRPVSVRLMTGCGGPNMWIDFRVMRQKSFWGSSEHECRVIMPDWLKEAVESPWLDHYHTLLSDDDDIMDYVIPLQSWEIEDGTEPAECDPWAWGPDTSPNVRFAQYLRDIRRYRAAHEYWDTVQLVGGALDYTSALWHTCLKDLAEKLPGYPFLKEAVSVRHRDVMDMTLLEIEGLNEGN